MKTKFSESTENNEDKNVRFYVSERYHSIKAGKTHEADSFGFEPLTQIKN